MREKGNPAVAASPAAPPTMEGLLAPPIGQSGSHVRRSQRHRGALCSAPAHTTDPLCCALLTLAPVSPSHTHRRPRHAGKDHTHLIEPSKSRIQPRAFCRPRPPIAPACGTCPAYKYPTIAPTPRQDTQNSSSTLPRHRTSSSSAPFFCLLRLVLSLPSIPSIAFVH